MYMPGSTRLSRHLTPERLFLLVAGSTITVKRAAHVGKRLPCGCSASLQCRNLSNQWRGLSNSLQPYCVRLYLTPSYRYFFSGA